MLLQKITTGRQHRFHTVPVDDIQIGMQIRLGQRIAYHMTGDLACIYLCLRDDPLKKVEFHPFGREVLGRTKAA